MAVPEILTLVILVRPQVSQLARLMELVYILVLETRFCRFESCIGHSTGRSGLFDIRYSKYRCDLYTRFEGASPSLLKCRSDPIGRGVRLKSEMLWVRVPPSVLDFISKHMQE